MKKFDDNRKFRFYNLTPMHNGWGYRLRILEIVLQTFGLIFFRPVMSLVDSGYYITGGQKRMRNPTPILKHRKNAMNNTDSPNFVIALEDSYDADCNTLHTLNDRSLWEWLHAPVSFPEGENLVLLPIPGTDETTEVSRGSAENDKAQALTSMDDEGNPHPLVTEVEFEDYEAQLKKLTAGAGPDNVYTGLWY